MKAVITVLGKDAVGIIAEISRECADMNANIVDITQKVMDGMFVMIMIVNIDAINVKFTQFVDRMETVGKEKNLVIHAMHEDIFNYMHRI